MVLYSFDGIFIMILYVCGCFQPFAFKYVLFTNDVQRCSPLMDISVVQMVMWYMCCDYFSVAGLIRCPQMGHRDPGGYI